MPRCGCRLRSRRKQRSDVHDHPPPRRKFLIAAAGLIAAPAIVRVGSIMPVKAYDLIQSQAVAVIEREYFTGRLILVTPLGDNDWEWARQGYDENGQTVIEAGRGLPEGWRIITNEHGRYPIQVGGHNA